MPIKNVPLASCIMPTYNRPELVRLAVKLWEDQIYPNRELIVLDDGDRPAVIPDHPRIKYVRLDGRVNVGTKHNMALGMAQGEFIVHWDDDDYSGPRRMVSQLEPIATGQADLTGLLTDYILKFPQITFMRWRPGYPKGQFKVKFPFHDATVSYHRRIWDSGIRYSTHMQAHKIDFIHAAMGAGFREMEIQNKGTYCYVRHGANVWQFPEFWLVEVEPKEYMGEVVKFYGKVA